MKAFQVAIGMDWADEKHAICVIDREKDTKESGSLEQTPEAISDWVSSLRRLLSALSSRAGLSFTPS